MQARLKVLHDKANVKQVKLLPVTLIGRSTECNLKIASSQVSRNHCRITLSDDAVFVEDLGSANGTLVDGQMLAPHQPTAIAPGSRLLVGPAEFQIDYVASTSATMVLGRSGPPPAPELPSTEMIFPTTPAFPVPAPVAVSAALAPAASVPVPVPQTVESVVTAPQPYVPQPVQDFAQTVSFVPQAVLAPEPVAPPVAVAPQPQVASAPTPQAAVTSRDPDTLFLSPAAESPTADLNFADNSATGNSGAGNSGEADEQTLFMFQESVPDTIPTSAAAAEPEAKKGGLKSLFSMFGRKDKAAGGTPTHKGTAATPAAAPSVFLPTMETQAVAEVSDTTETVEFDDPPAAPVATANTSEPTEEAQASTEGEDGFEQFLSQL